MIITQFCSLYVKCSLSFYHIVVVSKLEQNSCYATVIANKNLHSVMTLPNPSYGNPRDLIGHRRNLQSHPAIFGESYSSTSLISSTNGNFNEFEPYMNSMMSCSYLSR